METTINKTVKGKDMNTIFETCEDFSVRFYDAGAIDNYNEETKYIYEITIRHAEGTDANKLFDTELNKIAGQTGQKAFPNRHRRIFNSPLIRFINFQDGNYINLIEIKPPYEDGTKYAMHDTEGQSKTFKSLPAAEARFDELADSREAQKPARSKGITGNYPNSKPEQINNTDKVKCNNCNWEGNEDDLNLIEIDATDTEEKATATEDKAGVVTRALPRPKKVDFLKGCPTCLTDTYLINIQNTDKVIQHTAGEWKALLGLDDKISIHGDKLKRVCTFPNLSDEAEANAARIVKCVNSHDALIVALNRILNQQRVNNNYADTCGKMMTIAMQALKNAE